MQLHQPTPRSLSLCACWVCLLQDGERIAVGDCMEVQPLLGEDTNRVVQVLLPPQMLLLLAKQLMLWVLCACGCWCEGMHLPQQPLTSRLSALLVGDASLLLQVVALYSEAQAGSSSGGGERMLARVRRFYRPQVWALRGPVPGCALQRSAAHVQFWHPAHPLPYAPAWPPARPPACLPAGDAAGGAGASWAPLPLRPN